jgi:hypothetical protein
MTYIQLLEKLNELKKDSNPPQNSAKIVREISLETTLESGKDGKNILKYYWVGTVTKMRYILMIF